MKKKITSLIPWRYSLKKTMLMLTFFLGATFTWQAKAQSYCIPTYNFNCTNDRISNVSLSGESIEVNNDSECSENNYGDYTDLTPADLLADETYTLLVSTDYIFPFYEDVRAWIDYNNNGEFEDDEEIAYTNANGLPSSGTGEFEFTVPDNVVPGNYRMRVRLVTLADDIQPCGFAENGETEDYTIEVLSPNACFAPENINFESLTNTEVDVTWTPNGNELQWEVLYGEESFDPENEEGIIVDVDNTPETTISNLEAETSYDVYVRSVCQEDVFSDWTGPETFTTEEETVGYCEGDEFDNQLGAIVSFSTSNGVANIDNQNIENPLGYHTFTDMIVSQEAGESFTVTGISVDEFILYVTAGVALYIDYNNDFEFDSSEQVYVSDDYVSPATATITIPENVEPGDYRLRIVSDYLAMSPGPCNALSSIHDYTLTVIDGDEVGCQAPTNVEVTNITDITAEVSWTAGADEDQWEVLYGEAGFDTDTEGESILVEENSYTIEGLEADTEYDVYVRSVCGEDEFSDLTGLETFTTKRDSDPYCEGDYFEEEGGIENFSTSGGVENINNIGITDPIGYHDFTEMTVSQVAGESFSFTSDIEEVNFINDAMVAVYIDYNNDFEFDPSEEVYFSNDWLTTTTGSIAIPEDTQPGSYRLRIVSDWLDILGPCEAAGSIHDYTLTVIDGDEVGCQAPTNVEVTNITDITAEVSWTAGADEDQWEVLYGEAGFDTDTEGESVLVEETSYTMTELEADTEYDVYVRSVCGEDEFSDLTGLETFTTKRDSDPYCEGDYFEEEGGIENFSTSGGVENINNIGITDPIGYHDFTEMTVSQVAGESFSFTSDIEEVNFINDAMVAVYIDYNNDFEFDPSEEVYFSNDWLTTTTGSIAIPEDTQPGSYRLRIVSDWLDILGPCEAAGSIHDYTLTVIDGDEVGCQAPTNVEVTNITDITAEVSWTAGADEDQWEVLYGEAGFDTDTEGESVLVEETSYTMTEL